MDAVLLPENDLCGHPFEKARLTAPPYAFGRITDSRDFGRSAAGVTLVG